MLVLWPFCHVPGGSAFFPFIPYNLLTIFTLPCYFNAVLVFINMSQQGFFCKGLYFFVIFWYCPFEEFTVFHALLMHNFYFIQDIMFMCFTFIWDCTLICIGFPYSTFNFVSKFTSTNEHRAIDEALSKDHQDFLYLQRLFRMGVSFFFHIFLWCIYALKHLVTSPYMLRNRLFIQNTSDFFWPQV